MIKLEVNLIIRGIISPTQTMDLCPKAQEEFGVFCAMEVVSDGQLYGGKICAGLDRQHPRDLFDIKYQLEHQGFADEIKTGFLFCLLSSSRPMHELLRPNLVDQRQTMKNQFVGMAKEEFTYEDYESTRNELILAIHSALTDKDRRFLLSFFDTEPDWNIYNFEKYPSIKWKLQNLHSLRENQPEKYQEHRELLRKSVK